MMYKPLVQPDLVFFTECAAVNIPVLDGIMTDYLLWC